MQEYNVTVCELYTEWKNREGRLHRKDGPSVEWASGSKEWHVNGSLHRLDGPAIEYADGIKEWYINGERLTEKEFLKRTSTKAQAKKVNISEIEELFGCKVEIVNENS